MDNDVMKSYADLFQKRSNQCHPDQAIARIVQNPDGTSRLEPTALADTTSLDFQRLLGPQGSLASTLGIPGIGVSSTTDCPTGTTGCFVDPFFHFPDLDRDTADCLYVPSFNDVPITISMATYFSDSFFKEVPFQEVTNTINKKTKDIINDIVYGNIFFNYIPLAALLLIVIWVLIIHGSINWETGVFLTAVIITVLWLGYLLFDTFIRGFTGDVFTQVFDEVLDNFNDKNEAIICNILKGYYAALNHMILPEAAICSSLTGDNVGPCDCFDTGIKLPDSGGTLKLPNPAIIINDQIRVGGEQRCNGINNNDTLLPVIDKACPCIRDIDGFTLSGLSSKRKAELLDCMLDTLPKDLLTPNPGFPCTSKISCLGTNCFVFPDLSPGLCATVGKIVACNK